VTDSRRQGNRKLQGQPTHTHAPTQTHLSPPQPNCLRELQGPRPSMLDFCCQCSTGWLRAYPHTHTGSSTPEPQPMKRTQGSQPSVFKIFCCCSLGCQLAPTHTHYPRTHTHTQCPNGAGRQRARPLTISPRDSVRLGPEVNQRCDS
jgi:hypothetical protein